MIHAAPAGPEAAAEVEALRRCAIEEAEAYRGGATLVGARRGVDPFDGSCVVGLIDDVAVGYAVIVEDPPVMRIEELFVLEGARCVGVGTAMLTMVLGSAPPAISMVEAIALPGMRYTKNFFEAHGLVAQRIVVGRHLGDG